MWSLFKRKRQVHPTVQPPFTDASPAASAEGNPVPPAAPDPLADFFRLLEEEDARRDREHPLHDEWVRDGEIVLRPKRIGR